MRVRRAPVAVALALGLAVGLATAAAAQAETVIGHRPIEDQLQGLTSLVPDTWGELGGGAYARGTPPEDLAAIIIQAAAVSREQVWPSLLPRLALAEVPEPTGSYASDLLDWELYLVPIALPGLEMMVEVAMAELDGVTYFVLFQSAPDEFDILRDQVLLPALDATAPLAPEPTPHPSTFDYRIEDVTFPGGSEDVMLAGTLTLPDGPGPHPVVVTMSGSGPSDRDESLAPITSLKPFAVLADALTSAGVGVLRYDDRGAGESTGDNISSSLDDFTADVRAAIDYLETRSDVDAGRIGLFGHSEGGLYAAKLGASDPRVSFIGLMAPAATDGVTLIRDQSEAMQRVAGADEDLIEAVVAYIDAVAPAILDRDAEEVEGLVYAFYGGLWDGLTEDQRALAGDRDTFARSRGARELAIYATEWLRSYLEYDPADDWAQVTVPVLAVFAGKDVQVLPEPNAAALRAALQAAGNEDVEIVIIDDANHLLQQAETGAFSEYGQLEPAFIDGFVDTVVDWMVVHAGVAE